MSVLYKIQHLTTMQFARRLGTDQKTLSPGATLDWPMVGGFSTIPALVNIKYAGTDRNLNYASQREVDSLPCRKNRRYSVAFCPNTDKVLAVVCHSREWDSTKSIEKALDKYADRDTSNARTITYITYAPGQEHVAANLLSVVCWKYNTVVVPWITLYEAPVVDMLHHMSVNILPPPVINSDVFGVWGVRTESWEYYPEYAYNRLNYLGVDEPVLCLQCLQYVPPENAPDFNLNGW